MVSRRRVTFKTKSGGVIFLRKTRVEDLDIEKKKDEILEELDRIDNKFCDIVSTDKLPNLIAEYGTIIEKITRNNIFKDIEKFKPLHWDLNKNISLGCGIWISNKDWEKLKKKWVK